MTRAELINHLEHLAEYVKYSEDAPALREVIEMLKTHEERTETHACDLISRLSEIRSQYNCFNESEEPYYRALSEVIKMLKCSGNPNGSELINSKERQ